MSSVVIIYIYLCLRRRLCVCQACRRKHFHAVNQQCDSRQMMLHLLKSNYVYADKHTQSAYVWFNHTLTHCVPLTLLSLAALWDTLQQKHSRAELVSVYSSDSKSAAIGRLYSDINFSLASGRPISGRFPRSRSVCTHTAGARKSKWKRVKMSCSLFVA